MRKYGLWILVLIVVCVAAIPLFSLHHQRRQQLVDYLLTIDKSFAKFDTIQELNLEASQAENEGNQVKEQELLKQSLDLLTVFIHEIKKIQPGSSFIQRLQTDLLQWSVSTQNLLLYRSKVVDTIKNTQSNLSTTNTTVDEYLKITQDNQNLRGNFYDQLHKDARWYFVDLSKYLKHVL